MTGLKIMLQHGHLLAMALSDTEARAIIKDWQSETYAIRNKAYIGGITPHGVEWAVKLEDIVAMHTFDVKELQGPQAPPGVSLSGLNLFGQSGRN